MRLSICYDKCKSREGDAFFMKQELHEDEGDIRDRNIIIARSIGNYLGHNSGALQIGKIGEVASTNMNGEETPTSLWRKY